MSTVGEVIADRLAAAGVRYVFGYPGGEVLDLIESLRGCGLEFVLTRHESAAAFMAGGVGEMTGTPGVCLSTLGPGATNLISGVADAYLDRQPMLAITGQLPADRYEITPHQRIDLGALFRPITKLSARLTPGNAANLMDKALTTAVAERPGPVHLELPSDVTTKEAADRPQGGPFGLPERHLGLAAPWDLDHAEDLLELFPKAVVLAGPAVIRDHAEGPFWNFVRAYGLPVVVSPKAKGVFEEDHPLFAGVIEALGTKVLFDFIQGAEMVVTVGFDPAELDKAWLYEGPVLHLDLISNTDEYWHATAEVVGRLAQTLDTLAMRAPKPIPEWGEEAAAGVRRSLQQAIDAAPVWPGGGVRVRELFETVRQALPPQTVVTCDVGAHKFATGQLWKVDRARTFFMSNGQSSMGYGLPTAMAAAFVHRDRPVVAFIGDGGLGMYLGELETIARHALRLGVVVLMDGKLSLIRIGQERRGYPEYGVGFTNPDLAQLGKAFGIKTVMAKSASRVASALKGLPEGGPVLVGVPVDPGSYRV